MNEHEYRLIEGYLDGTIAAADFGRLESLLRNNPEARKSLRDLATIDAKLQERAAADLAMLPLVMPAKRPVSYAAAAMAFGLAGLLVGVLGTSMVWARVFPAAASAPRQAPVIFEESFEDSSMRWQEGFPRQAECWGGDGTIVSAEEGIAPRHGSRMLNLTGAISAFPPRANYVIDLEKHPNLARSASREIQVTASFRSAGRGHRARYMLRSATFAQDLESIDPRWMGDLWGEVADQALDRAARGVTCDPHEIGWQNVTLSISAPRGARYLVISCGAGNVEKSLVPVYVDDVRVTSGEVQTP